MNKGLKVFFGIMSASPVLFLLGLALSFYVYVKIPLSLTSDFTTTNILMIVGAILIIGGTTLAFAAQRVSRQVSRPSTTAATPDLMRGPYRYSRHPGSLSLIIMYTGFALVVNSLVMIIAAGIFILLLTFIFVPLEEKVIESLCPDAYREYRTKVRMWL